jgi:hypothetical protein
VIEAFKRLTADRSPTGEVIAYMLWRFARDGRRQLARAMAATTDQFIRMVQGVENLRLQNPVAHEAMSRLEWRMTFALGGAPWRV